MPRNSQSIAIWLAWVLMVVPLRAQDAKQAEPITLNNVQQVGLLSEIKSGAHYLEPGPGPNELMLTLRDGIEVVDRASVYFLGESKCDVTIWVGRYGIDHNCQFSYGATAFP